MGSSSLSRRDFMRVTAALGGLLAVGAGAGCATQSRGRDGVYRGDVAITGLASLIHSAPFLIAASEGYYEEEMLALENVQFPGGLDTVRGIGSGIGFGTSATIPVFIAVERGLDVKAFGNVYTAASVDFIAPADSPINTIEDVRGRTIGVSSPGSNSTDFAEKTLRLAGLTPGVDVELLSVGSASDSWTVASQGVVDVAWTASPLSERIIAETGAKVIWRSRDYVQDWSDTCLCATTPFIEKNRDVLAGWMGAVGRGIEMIDTDLERAAEIYGRAIKYKPEIALAALENSRGFFSLDFARPQLEAVVASGVEAGRLGGKVDIDAVVVEL